MVASTRHPKQRFGHIPRHRLISYDKSPVNLILKITTLDCKVKTKFNGYNSLGIISSPLQFVPSAVVHNQSDGGLTLGFDHSYK